MLRKGTMRKLISVLTVFAMSVTAAIPTGFSVYASESGSKSAAEILNTTISGDIGTANKDNYVTGLAEDPSGNLIVVGTAKSKMGDTDSTGNVQRVFLKKYSKTDLNRPSASAVIGGALSEDIEQNGYVFGKKEAAYSAGDSTYNGAVTTDSAGNVYVAVTEKATSSALYDEYWELEGNFDDCTCEDIWSCDESECDSGDTTDCPVCNAFRTFNETFRSGGTKTITLYKFTSELKPAGSLILGGYASTSTSTLDDPWAHGIAVDGNGNIYAGGATPTDLGFENPQKDFDHYSDKKGKRGFIAKVNSDMTKITASTYLAGNKGSGSGFSVVDAAVNNLAVDGNNLYAIGKDGSGMLENTAGTLQPEKNSSDSVDAYIAKLSLDDLHVTSATYYGGSSSEEVSALKIKDGYVYVGGDTTSTDLQVSENAACETKDNSMYTDGFVLKADKSLKKTGGFAASYLNGSGREDLFDLDVDDNGNIYVTGQTTSGSGFETTDGSDSGKIFVAKFSSDASAISALSVLGENGSYEQGRGIKADTDATYLAGQYGSGQLFLAKYNQSFAHAKIKRVEAVDKGSSYSPRYYGTGAVIGIKVTFDTGVAVTGAPKLSLNLTNNNTNQSAEYKSGNGTKTLTFEYTVKDGDTTDGSVLEVSGANGMDLNGGTILPKAGGTAEDIDLTLPTAGSNLGSGYIYVKTAPAKVKSVTSSAENGTYGKGAVIPITVTFDDDIKSVTGTPELKLNSGGTALYKGIKNSNKKTLEFEYTVGAGENTEDLDYQSVNSLILPNGASIKDNYGTDVDCTLPELAGEGSLSNAKDITVNQKTVIVESITVDDSYKNRAYRAGAKIPIIVTFSGNITTTSDLKLKLNAAISYNKAMAVADPVENKNAVTLTYTVDTEETADCLDYTTANALTLADGGMIASGNNPVSLHLAEPGSEKSLSKCKIQIDNKAPSNSYAPTVVNSSKNYRTGDVMTLKVPLTEKVSVKNGAKPYIEMNYKTDPSAAENNRWIYDHMEDSGTTSTLFFSYTVKQEDALNKGSLYDSSNWKVYMETGDITDAAGNEMSPALKTLSAYANPLKDIYFDSVAPAWEEAASLKAENVEGRKTVSITRPNAVDTGSGLSSSPYPYTLYRQTKGSKDEPEQVTTLSSSKNTYEDTRVEEDTTYVYTLIARDKCGNTSLPLTAEIKTANSAGELEDNEPPYWDDDATLTVTRTTESTVVASWDHSKAHDAVSSIKEFRVYIKTGLLGGWELIGTVPGNQDSAELTGLELEESYQFKVEAVDDGRNTLESTTGPQAELKEEYPAISVSDQNGKNIKRFLDSEFTVDELTRSRFSSLNNYKTKEYYAVSGMDVSQLLKKAGVKNYTYVTITSYDKSSSKTFTKAQIEGEDSNYYPPAYDGVKVKEQQVKPKIAFWYNASEGGEPDFSEGGDGLPRLFFGQSKIGDINKPEFIKEVGWITVNVVEEGISFTESENYIVEKSEGLPAVTAVKDGAATVSMRINGNRFDSDKLCINLIQMRGNEMIAITSAEKTNGDDMEVGTEFDLKKGDLVKVIVTGKRLDGKKGSAAEIINAGALNTASKIDLKDVYLKNTDIAAIRGKAKATSWVSLKITDKDSNIIYFDGTFTDKDGNFNLNASVKGTGRPLDITVTNGTSVATSTIYDFKELKIVSASNPNQQFTAGKKAAAINSGITGTGVKYQWYSNTRKSASGGKAIKGATSKTYVPSTSKAGLTYYYAVAKDMDGNTKNSTVFTVKVAAKAPTAKAVSKGYQTIRIDWTASPGVSKYQLYRATTKSGKYSMIKTTTARGYTNSSLTFNKMYYYKVVAVSSGGNGTSMIVSAKPALTKTSITSIKKNSNTTRYVKWSKVAGATGYEVTCSTSKNFKQGKKTVIVKQKTSTTIKKLKKGKKYYVRVRAYRTEKGKKVYGPYSAVKVK